MDARFKEIMQRIIANTRDPLWFPDLARWRWMTPVLPGSPILANGQGLSSLGDLPGLANLLWLTLDMDAPPTVYDARNNFMYSWVLRSCHVKLSGVSLEEAAASLTLQQFSQLNTNDAHINALIALARRKVRNYAKP